MIRQTWNSLSDGTCTRTLRQHSDYVTCLAAAEKNVICFSIFSWILNAWMKGSCQFVLLNNFCIQYDSTYCLEVWYHITSKSSSDPFIVSCILEQYCCLWWPWGGGFHMGSWSRTCSAIKVRWCNGRWLFKWYQWFRKFTTNFKFTYHKLKQQHFCAHQSVPWICSNCCQRP